MSDSDSLICANEVGSDLSFLTTSEARARLLAGHVRHLPSDDSSGCPSNLRKAAIADAASHSSESARALYLTCVNLLSTTAPGVTPEARTLTIPEAHFGFPILCPPLHCEQSISIVIPSFSSKLCLHVLSSLSDGTSFFEGLSPLSVIAGRAVRPLFYRMSIRSLHVTPERKGRRMPLGIVRSDTDAVGGFFEDLLVLAFILAGVLSVSGTAAWVSESIDETARSRNLEEVACSLVSGAVLVLRTPSELPSTEHVVNSDLSGLVDRFVGRLSCLVTLWCVHPYKELLLIMERGSGAPTAASSDRAYMNVLCAGGLIGVLEVRAFVWCP